MPKKSKSELENYEIYGSRRDWTTADECDWLNRIGDTISDMRTRGSFAGELIPRLSKRQLLESYVRNFPNRAKWGDINAETALEHARGLLQRMDLG
jgi:hypothetical protein